MFHLKNLINTLGLCLCAVLLLVPAASQAMPAGDEHFVLPYDETAVLPGGDGSGATAAGTTCSLRLDAPMGEQCKADCETSYDGCMASCAGSWSPLICEMGCGVAKGFCVFGCRFTSY